MIIHVYLLLLLEQELSSHFDSADFGVRSVGLVLLVLAAVVPHQEQPHREQVALMEVCLVQGGHDQALHFAANEIIARLILVGGFDSEIFLF